MKRCLVILLGLCACDPPRRTAPPVSATATDAAQESVVPTAFDHAGAYRGFLARMRIADPGDRVVEQLELARGAVHCFALREGQGLRLKACVTPSGLVRDGITPGASPTGVGDDWSGLLAAAPDAPTAAAWVAWLLTDESPSYHGPTAPRPTTALTAAGVDAVAPAHRGKVGDPELVRGASSVRFAAWFAKPGLTAPIRLSVEVSPTQTIVTQTSAVELP